MNDSTDDTQTSPEVQPDPADSTSPALPLPAAVPPRTDQSASGAAASTSPAPPDGADPSVPALPFPAAVPPWTDRSAGGAAATPLHPTVSWAAGGAVSPPPPPPSRHGDPSGVAWAAVGPPSWPPTPTAMWQGAAAVPEHRARNPWLIAGAMAAILGMAFSGGFLADRLSSSSSPVSSASSGSAAAPLLPGSGSGSTGSGSGATPPASSGSGDTSGVAAKVTPGIVNINVTLDGGEAAGTGMLITSTGEVLTNNHVIDGETSIHVELPSTGKTYSAHVLGWDATDDVALVQIDNGPSFSTVSIGNSSSVTVGQAVVALGNALGKNGAPSVTSGSVTALNRSITASDQGGGAVETVSGLIQIDASIQPGDSGGPLVTSDGTVIGMDTAAEVSSDSFSQNGSTIAYAIPINHALSIVRQVQAGTATTAIHLGATRALLGVGAQDAAGSNGVTVQSVQPGSAAEKAGITVGSTITALNGQSISTNSTLRAAILTHQPGDSVSVTWTDTAGQSHTAPVTLTSGPPA